jgi:putative Holliday junction resolvase
VAAVVTGEASEAAALESGAAAAADIAGVVIGLPRRLGGEDSDLTAAAREFAGKVAAASGLAVYLQDERLTSHAADERLAARERDWRRRKQKLDAAAAAVMLQDFLDALPRQTAATPAADSEC